MCLVQKLEKTWLQQFFNIKLKPVYKIADKDIECYKVYRHVPGYNDIPDNFQSVYQGTYHEIGYQKKIDFESEFLHVSRTENSIKRTTHKFEYGYHSFVSLEHLIEHVKKDYYNDESSLKYFDEQYRIVICCIPEGTKYVEGVWDMTYWRNYCSEVIVLRKAVTLSEILSDKYNLVYPVLSL